jgi:transcriptional regulator with XRE-family HTH domain
MNKHLINTKIGKNIKKIRKLKGITQSQLASKIGISRPSVVNIELGKQSTYSYQLFKIASFLNIELSSIFPDIKELTEIINIDGSKIDYLFKNLQ